MECQDIFFFLMVPYTAAYAWHAHLGILFPVWTLLLATPFVLLCGAIGTLISLAAVRWFPRSRLVWSLLAALVLAVTVHGIIQIRPVMNENASFILNRFLPGLQLAAHPLMPNSWVSEGIMALTIEEINEKTGDVRRVIEDFIHEL